MPRLFVSLVHHVSHDFQETEMGRAASNIHYVLALLICCLFWQGGSGRAQAYELVIPALEFREGQLGRPEYHVGMGLMTTSPC
jgi:hypothetical protein